MGKPLIVEIHLVIAAAAWESARTHVVGALKKKSCRNFFIVPLYVNSDLENTELRICAQVQDPARVAEFVAQRLKVIPGVLAARARLTLQGHIFGEGVKAFALQANTYVSCHVFIHTCPGKDEQAWKALRRLRNAAGVKPVWIFRDYYEYDRDITLRLMGGDVKRVREYVDARVSVLEGIQSWHLQYTHSATKILGDKELLALAQAWCAHSGEKDSV